MSGMWPSLPAHLLPPGQQSVDRCMGRLSSHQSAMGHCGPQAMGWAWAGTPLTLACVAQRSTVRRQALGGHGTWAPWHPRSMWHHREMGLGWPGAVGTACPRWTWHHREKGKGSTFCIDVLYLRSGGPCRLGILHAARANASAGRWLANFGSGIWFVSGGPFPMEGSFLSLPQQPELDPGPGVFMCCHRGGNGIPGCPVEHGSAVHQQGEGWAAADTARVGARGEGCGWYSR